MPFVNGKKFPYTPKGMAAARNLMRKLPPKSGRPLPRPKPGNMRPGAMKPVRPGAMRPIRRPKNPLTYKDRVSASNMRKPNPNIPGRGPNRRPRPGNPNIPGRTPGDRRYL